ncbi:PEP-CTERM sorting domain-containing protein [Paraglaciecola sp. MB-3u-78]|uniref:PEP-CTERM sorting domain-containing protein n=1 Tax=Paraglaciecola sp. MB-3u-78 TaxID=2058332 RepID=UPI000C330520|nr:PEP-CTERM sorting domain-containing protein [Paraglaciecola sp. MB-3u-78]PKG97023.1 hypothetical protein CXF95_22215 [Paraglaciecola sp. MB-3u-78]
MFKMVSKILGVIALTGWMGVANATLIFDFSWDSSNGKIIGEIYGLSDDGDNMGATGLVLTSVGVMHLNYNVFEDNGWTVHNNSFDVMDGEFKDINFYASYIFGGVERIIFIFDWGATYRGTIHNIEVYLYNGGNKGFYDATGVGVFGKRVTVPEPSSVILMLLGLAGLSFARYRKQY